MWETVRFDTSLPGIDGNGNPRRNPNRNNGGYNNNRNRNNSPYNNKNGNKNEGKRKFKLQDYSGTLNLQYHSDDNTEDDYPKKSNRTHSIEDKGKMISNFVNSFAAEKRNPNNLISQMATLEHVVEIMGKYYENGYDNILDDMNRMIDLGTSKLFASTLSTAIDRNVINIGDPDVIVNIKKFINMLLTSMRSKMTDETANIYMDIVVETLDPISVSMMMEDYGISEDLAEDLIISVPTCGTRATTSDIKLYSIEFIRNILNHSNTAITILNAENQAKLFYHLYGYGNENNVSKAIGCCLSDVLYNIDDEKEPKESALYDEYAVMLYTTLNNDFDIKDIKSVLRFIAKTVDEDELKNVDNILFDSSVVLGYDNITKAFNDLVESGDKVFNKVFIQNL